MIGKFLLKQGLVLDPARNGGVLYDCVEFGMANEVLDPARNGGVLYLYNFLFIRTTNYQ